MKNEIEKKLNELKSYKLERLTRNANMGYFVFSDILCKKVFELHIQCPWRVEIGASILVANGDMYLPTSCYSGEWDDFHWDVKGANLFDEIAEKYASFSLYPFYISKVVANMFGDLTIEFDKNARLVIFINNSNDEEQWRLLSADDREEHFVVSALGVEEV